MAQHHGGKVVRRAAPQLLIALLAALFLVLALSVGAQAVGLPAAFGAADCTSGKPNLVVDYKYTYWASLPDYLLRRLSVITTLKNASPANASDVSVVGGSASDGVTVVTSFPIDIGDFAPGQARGYKIVYQVPLLLSSFSTVTAATAADGCGSVYPYSYGMTNQVTLMPPLLPL